MIPLEVGILMLQFDGMNRIFAQKDVPGSRISALGHERLAIVGAMDDPQV